MPARRHFEVANYSEHSLSAGTEASALAYIQIKTRRRQDLLGRGRGHEHRTGLDQGRAQRGEQADGQDPPKIIFGHINIQYLPLRIGRIYRIIITTGFIDIYKARLNLGSIVIVIIILLVTMKLRIIPATLSFLATGLLIAAPGSSDSIGTITTSLGRSYQECRVCQVDPDGVIFAHQKGIAKVLFGELPEALRAKLGYDAQKAADYAKEQAEKKRRAQELQAELQKEAIKAQAAVSVAEIQSAGLAQQSYAAGGGGWGYPGYTGGLYGWDNSLYNGGYAGPYNNQDRGWNGANCGTPGGTILRYKPSCGATPLSVFSINRGGFGVRELPAAGEQLFRRAPAPDGDPGAVHRDSWRPRVEPGSRS